MFKHVLFIGPQIKNHRGGMGAVLEVYAEHIEDFRFIASFDGNKTKMGNLIVFLICVFKMTWQLILCREIKIVHLHGASKGSFYRKYILFMIAKYLGGRKVVYHLHAGSFGSFYSNSSAKIKKIIDHLFSKADCVICLSDSWLEYLNRVFKCRKLIVINNPVSMRDKLYYRDEKASSPMHFLFLGLINRDKGIFDLLEVIALEKNVFEGRIRLTIGGSGEVERLEEFIKEKGLDNVVHFLGWVSGSQKEAALSACDVLILPSYIEGLPVSILEAMSFGKAIVSTSVGGIPEIVSENENGFLFTPGDMKAMSTLLKRLVADPESVKRLGDNSLQKIQPYLIHNVLTKLNENYKSII